MIAKSALIALALICCTVMLASPAYATDEDAWSMNIIPYFWAVDITGDIEVGVPVEGVENQLLHISENFTSLWKHIHNGGMLDINVNKARFGLFTNAMYVSIKNINVTTSDGFEVSVNSKFALFSAGLLYRYERDLANTGKVTLAPYAGARYTKNDSSAILIEAPEYGDRHKAYWTEPFIGAMFRFDINQRWSVNLAGDVGGLIKNQDSYNVTGLIGYEAMECLTLYLGYRQLYQSFTEGSGPTFFEWKMHVRGPILGVAFGF